MEQTKKLNMTAMSDKTNSNTTAKKEEPAWEHKVAMKVSGVSIAVNLLLSLFKLLAGIVAHSGAMISDAIHSASDVGSTFVVIVGVNLSSKKSDKEHQYGHERMECVSSIILSGLLLATGIGIGMSGIENIIKSTSGASIAVPGTLALIAAVVSIVVKEWMFWYTRSAAKKINSGALMADAWAPSFRRNVFCWCIYWYPWCKTWIPDPGSTCQCCNLCTDRESICRYFQRCN